MRAQVELAEDGAERGRSYGQTQSSVVHPNPRILWQGSKTRHGGCCGAVLSTTFYGEHSKGNPDQNDWAVPFTKLECIFYKLLKSFTI